MDGVHALVDHLRSIGLSADPTGRCVLPLAFHNGVELDSFILEWFRRVPEVWDGQIGSSIGGLG